MTNKTQKIAPKAPPLTPDEHARMLEMLEQLAELCYLVSRSDEEGYIPAANAWKKLDESCRDGWRATVRDSLQQMTTGKNADAWNPTPDNDVQ